MKMGTTLSPKSKSQKTFVGLLAIFCGTLLGVAWIAMDTGWSSPNSQVASILLVSPVETVTASAPGSGGIVKAGRCQTNSRAGQINAPMVTDQNCLIQCNGGPTGKGPKGAQNPACLCGQELGNADAGVTNCFNPGECRPPAGLPPCSSVPMPKLPGGEMPMMPMMGGMPMLPMIPMPMPKPDMGMMPMPQQPVDEECKPGILSSFGFGSSNCPPSTTDTQTPIQKAGSSIVDGITNFFGWGSAPAPVAETPKVEVIKNGSTNSGTQAPTTNSPFTAPVISNPNNAGTLAPSQNNPQPTSGSGQGAAFPKAESTFTSGSGNTSAQNSAPSAFSGILNSLSAALQGLLARLPF